VHGTTISSSGSTRATGSGSGGGGGGNNYYGSTTRHSYSLSTFSPNGDIDQIVRAMRASMLGLPLVVLSVPRVVEEKADCEDAIVEADYDHASTVTDEIISSSLPSSSIHSTTHASQGNKSGSIYVCLPQRYLSASPLCIDTGTPHILQLTSSICLSHTGITADGRPLLDHAIELTLDYRYVYGVEMPVQQLLMGLADKMMEMTRRAGWRPFGCALLVMSLGDEEDDMMPTMYRVDPSGVVVLLNPCPTRDRIGDDIDDYETGQEVLTNKSRKNKPTLSSSSAAFLGNWDEIIPRHELDAIRERIERRASYMSEEEIQSSLVDIVRRTFAITASSTESDDKSTRRAPMLFASFTRERGLQTSRIE
jgi:hypothetical protein